MNAIGGFSLDLEHRHSGLDVIISGAGNACPICQAFEISKLKKEIEELNLIIKCYKEDQRVSSESFNFNFERLKKAHAVLDKALRVLELYEPKEPFVSCIKEIKEIL